MKCKRVLLHFIYLYFGSFHEIFKALLVFSGFNGQGDCVYILFSLPLMIVSELCLLVSVCVCQLIYVSPWPRPLWAWISSSEVGCTRSAIPSLFGTRDQFHGRWLFYGPGQGESFRMIQGHYEYYALYLYYYYISSTLGHQAVDAGGWGPLI